MIKTVIVGGDWDQNGGRSSFWVSQLSEALVRKGNVSYTLFNGGVLGDLIKTVSSRVFKNADVLLWMPNLSNVEDKILPNIKKNYPKLVLIQSKRVDERDYSQLYLIKRLLSSHSALGLVIDASNGKNQCKVIDPLGNLWYEGVNVPDIAEALFTRAFAIARMSRVGCVRSGDRENFTLDPKYLEVVRELGIEFDNVINAANPERFLGNSSTRCSHGFPSFRSKGEMFVSKRNVDKTIISSEQFVEVELDSIGVRYKGDHKPSVDTPIQLALYRKYPNVNFLVHGHCYVEGAPTTEENIPCGFTEEVNEILKVQPQTDMLKFVVNLKGHGCLLFSDTIEGLKDHKFISRDVFEDMMEET
jgi:hypothetical protein